MRHHPLLVGLMLLALAGCRLPEDEWGVVRVVWNEFPWWSVIWRLGLWTLLGAALGLMIGILFTFLLRRWGAYRLPWPRVRFWLQCLIITLNLIAMPILFGVIGFFEGVYRSGEVALRRSVIGREVLPKVAEECADVLVAADRMLEREVAGPEEWEEVHGKKHSVNITRLCERIDRLKAEAAEKLTAKAKEKLFEENPDLKGGVGETVIDWTLPPLLKYLLNRKLHAKMKEYGIPDFLDEMKAEATKDGDDLMTHKELTDFLTDRVLIRAVLYPLRKWMSGLQTTTLGIIAAWFATPVVLMFLTRYIVFWWKRRTARRLCPDRL
ncbi:MAG: hypothetical protein HYX68_17775 [Planctomycetes bacterium]|nr:hypothetical protein [Planctomycetota bacterium]